MTSINTQSLMKYSVIIKNNLHHHLQDIPTYELLNAKYVCIDMYHPYKDLVNLYFKKANINVDSLMLSNT